jgi:hypothetical protein
VMTNSDEGMALVGEIMQAIATEYGWPSSAPRVVTPLAMSAEAMREFAGRYTLAGRRLELTIVAEDGRLMATQTGGRPFEIVPTGAGVFTPLIDAPPFRFDRDGAGTITTLVVGGTRLERQP